MKTDYEWAPIPGASPEAEAVLAALKDRKASDDPDHAVKTMVLGDAAATATEDLVKALRKHTGVSFDVVLCPLVDFDHSGTPHTVTPTDGLVLGFPGGL